MQYDSIYLYEGRDFKLNKELTEHTKADTLVLTKIEYCYRFLRDTTYIHRVDSIPVIKEVETSKDVRCVPLWCKCLSAIGAIVVFLLVIQKKVIRMFSSRTISSKT